LLSQPPLLRGRQGSKVRIILQRPFLLAGRQILVLPQPIPGMALRLVRRSLGAGRGVRGGVRRSLRSCRRGLVGVFLGQARQGKGDNGHTRSHPSRDVSRALQKAPLPQFFATQLDSQ
jgi:hypothetical protein